MLGFSKHGDAETHGGNRKARILSIAEWVLAAR